MKRVVLLAALVALTACSPKNPVLFDGQNFRMRDKSMSRDDRSFRIEVRNAAADEEAARKAARYQATVYCMNRFSTSDMVWATADDAVALTESGDLIREGECASR